MGLGFKGFVFKVREKIFFRELFCGVLETLVFLGERFVFYYLMLIKVRGGRRGW